MSTTQPATIVKARLRNFGNGVLDVGDDTVKFYVETGRFRKHRETIRNIPIAEIERVERQENDLSLTWKENTDVFAITETAKVLEIHERILAGLKEQQKTPEPKVPEEQKQVDKTKLHIQETAATIEVTNALFNMLGHLHGRVNWKLVEISNQQVEEATAKLASLGTDFAFLDPKPLSVAVQQRYPKEIADRTLDALKTLDKRFNGEETPQTEIEAQNHPNRNESRTLIQAFYVLNDLSLGNLVGDKESGKEESELLKLVEQLSNQPNSRIKIKAVKASFEKLSLGREKRQEGLEELQATLEQQHQALALLASNTQQESPTPTPAQVT